MNKYGKIIAFALSACAISLIEAQITIESGSADCTSSEDAQSGKKCTCTYNTKGLPGKCSTGIEEGIRVYRCKCEPGSILIGEAPSAIPQKNTGIKLEQEANAQPTPTNFSVYIFSQDINAPIYDLPMQRALVPLSHSTIDCPWFFSVAPYGKTTQKQTIGNTKLENTEAGSLLQAGYYGSYWFANTIASFGGTKTNADLGNNLHNDQWHFGFTDALFALGLKTNKDRDSISAAHGEVFFGVSSNKFNYDNSKDTINKALFNVGNPSVGVQGNIDFTLAKFNTCKFEFSLFSRFIHFFKKTIETGNQRISYTPGSFIDMLFGLTQYYGSDYQHQFEIGYNPTVRLIKAEALNTLNQPAAKLNEPKTDDLYHTAYATYSYNWESNGLPMMFSLGGSATVMSHTNTYGTVFGSFGLSF